MKQDEEKIIVESRVRFLSFLGIGRQVEHCGFIVHTANDVYIAHVMCCHPSSGAICKTIEAACKVKEKSLPLYLDFFLNSIFLIVSCSCATRNASTLTAPFGAESPVPPRQPKRQRAAV